MSRKQEIYRELLRWALPSTRNTFSWFRQIRPMVILWPKMQRHFASQYILTEFIHNLYVSILEEEFIDHDIHFLNYQARIYHDLASETDPHLFLFIHYIQELFGEVPETRRSELLWEGPQGDYSWARPRRGDQWTDESHEEFRQKSAIALELLRQNRRKSRARSKN